MRSQTYVHFVKVRWARAEMEKEPNFLFHFHLLSFLNSLCTKNELEYLMRSMYYTGIIITQIDKQTTMVFSAMIYYTNDNNENKQKRGEEKGV